LRLPARLLELHSGHSSKETRQTCVQVYIEGPYGAPAIDVHSAKYKSFLIISSGLGWTFGRAMKRQLLSDAVRGRPLRSIRSVAVVRELAASTLQSCWGWDLREREGEIWPSGLHALVRPFRSCCYALTCMHRADLCPHVFPPPCSILLLERNWWSKVFTSCYLAQSDDAFAAKFWQGSVKR
jgi:hypothetical protein